MITKFSTSIDGLYYKNDYIADFWPELISIKIIRNPHLDSETRIYTIKPHLADGTTLPEKEVESLTKISYFELWPECCDADLMPAQLRALHKYLQLQVKKTKPRIEYNLSALGLYNEGFLFSNNKFICFNDCTHQHFISDKNVPDFDCPTIDRESLVQYASKLLALKPGVTDVLFAARLFAVLKPLLHNLGYPIDFFIAIYGRSCSMKTTLGRLFFVDNADQILSFVDCTKKQVSLALNSYVGHAVLLDNYHKATYQENKKQLSRLVFVAHDKDSPEHALVVTTGEFLEGSFSVQDRMIQVNIDRPVDDIETLTWLQENSDCLNTLAYEFAKTIYQNLENTQSWIADWMCQHKFSIKNSDDFFRINTNIRMLYLSIDCFRHFFLKTDFEKVFSAADIFSSFKALVDRQVEHLRLVRMLENGLDWIDVFYNLIDSKVLPLTNQFVEENNHRILATLHDGRIYISRFNLRDALYLYFKKPIDMHPLLLALAEAQILCEDSTTGHGKKYKDKYYYVIDAAKLSLYHHRIEFFNANYLK